MLRSKWRWFTIGTLLLLSLLPSLTGAGSRFDATRCLKLDGAGYASHADDAALNWSTGDAMIGGWVNLTDQGVHPLFYKNAGGADAGLIFYSCYIQDGIVKANLDDNVTLKTFSSSNTVNDGSWHRIDIVYDRSANGAIYIDGVQDGTPVAINAVGDIDNDNLVRLGFGAGVYFTGRLALWEMYYLGYNGVDPTEAADYAARRFADPYGSLEKVMPDWSGYDDADRGEALNETDFATHAKWDVTNDWDDTGGNAHYVYTAEQFSNLTQTAANRAKAGDGSAWYELTYTTVENTALVGGDIYIGYLGGGGFVSSAVVLPLTTGTHRKVFQSISTASTGTFGLIAGNNVTAGDITITAISLKRVGRVASWPMNGNYNDQDEAGAAGPNALDLTAGGTGNEFVGSTVRATRFETVELVTNGDFEADPDGTSPPTGWINKATPTVNETDDAKAHGGTKSCKITVDATGDGAQSTTTVSVVAGEWYEIIVWAYGDGTKKWSIKGWGPLHGNIMLSLGTVVPAAWTRYSLVFQAQHTENISIQMYSGTDNNDGTAWFDDVSCKLASRVRFED